MTENYKDLLVMLFPNGVTAVFDGNNQVPELQESWIRLYLNFLQSKGVDPTKCKFYLPTGMTAEVAENNEGGFSWSILNHNDNQD